MKGKLLVAAVLAPVLNFGIAGAESAEPFYSFNQSPVVQVHGLPALGSTALLKKGEARLQFISAISNNFTGDENQRESLILDGESVRRTLVIALAPTESLELGVEVPFVRSATGTTDSIVDSTHELLGVHTSREEAPRDRLIYSYRRDGESLIDVRRPFSGLGDLRLTAATRVDDPEVEDGIAVVLRSQLKLPTGDARVLLGSGGIDVATWISVAAELPPETRFRWFLGTGALRIGRGRVLPDQHRDLMWFGTAGLQWQLAASYAVQTQLDMRTPTYRTSDLSQISGESAELVMGVLWERQRGRGCALSLSEDVIVNNSPDVTLQFACRTELRVQIGPTERYSDSRGVLGEISRQPHTYHDWN